MKRNAMRRIGAVLAAAGISAVCFGALTGCTTDRPEITIIYTFLGEEYPVDYTLSRDAAPKTVQHFLELIEAGYYDGTCIHSYSDSYLYAGAYTLGEGGDLEEIDYFSKVRELEKEGKKFTQSVFMPAAESTDESPVAGEGLYTVYGEMQSEKYSYDGTRYRHGQGALVMYYTATENFPNHVITQRNDGGKGREDKNAYQYESYAMNSAAATFYTCLGTGSDTARDKQYCVFGKATKFDEQMTNGLLAAIEEWKENHEDTDFTEEWDAKINELDHLCENDTTFPETIRDYFKELRVAGATETYTVPVATIGIKTAKINKY